MEGQPEDERLMTEYLLDELPDSERNRLERHYFTDDRVFDQLLAVEDELIDQYVSGDLNARELGQFERSFILSPRRQQKVELAKAIRLALSKTPESAPETRPLLSRLVPRWRNLFTFPTHPADVSYAGLGRSSAKGHSVRILGWALATVMLLLLGGSVWLIRDTQRQVDQGNLARAEIEQKLVQEQAHSRNLDEDLQRERQQVARLTVERSGTQPTISDIALSGSVSRSDSEPHPTLRLVPGVKIVRFRMSLADSNFQVYRAVVRTADNQMIATLNGLKAGRARTGEMEIEVLVQASLFTRADYTLRLSGLTPRGRVIELADYSFSVDRR